MRLTDTHRESLVSVLGAPPEMCPPEPELISSEQLDGYRREKIAYFVNPGERVASYVLIPDDLSAPAPAVVCHHRHSDDWNLGKSEIVGLAGDPDEALGVDLVRRGYVVLAVDALAFEERRPNPDAGYENNVYELTMRLLKGETLLRKNIWDVSRGIDLLESLPEVDLERIGAVGHGYGSLMAAWVAALDMRVVVGVGHRHWTSLHETIRQRNAIPVEFAVPKLLQVADYDWVLGLIAPRPFLLSALYDDPTCLDTLEIYRKAKQVYERFEVGERLNLLQSEAPPKGARFPLGVREQAYAWLDRWLKGY